MDHISLPLPAIAVEECLHHLLASAERRHEQRYAEALQCLDAIPEPYASLPPSLTERAIVLAEMGLFEQSICCCQSMLAYAPSAEHRNLLSAIKNSALAHLSDSDSEEATLSRGNIHLLVNEFAAAMDAYEHILAHSPNHPDALANKGFCLAALQHPEAAAACYARLLTNHPEDAGHWFNLGNVLKDLNRLDDAIDVYQKAISLRPDFAEAHLEICLCRFAAGWFTEGWTAYEWRWKTRQLSPHYLNLPTPAWLGESAIDDKTILLWAEQGLGDTLQFARFVPLVAERARQVILRVDARLLPLMQRLAPRVTVIDTQTPVPPHDTHCPLMSLPLALKCFTPWAPVGDAYLSPTPAALALWATRLGPKTRRRIGLCWAGKQSGQTNPPRDVPFAELAPLWTLDADFVSLQMDVPENDLPDTYPAALRIDVSSQITDFSDTAALVAGLDLVISVDSALAHLAGALGTPCWLMLRFAAEWRWQTKREDSPWYPSLRLFRQPCPGNWGAVVDAIATALKAPAATRTSPAKDSY